jgi:arsenate reductase-like glutaredoxin family protein
MSVSVSDSGVLEIKLCRKDDKTELVSVSNEKFKDILQQFKNTLQPFFKEVSHSNGKISFKTFGGTTTTLDLSDAVALRDLAGNIHVPDMPTNRNSAINQTFADRNYLQKDAYGNVNVVGNLSVRGEIIADILDTKVDKEEFYNFADSMGVMHTTLWNKTENVEKSIGNIDKALDELHTYAQNLVNGGAEV